MTHRGVRRLPFAVLALAVSLSTFAQSIVSTHSGVVYFFEGSVFIEDQPLEQKFGKFPEIGDGHQLRTAHGRAEVLLTPGVFLRMNESSAIRMLSIKLSDTRVELLDGSAIVEANEAVPGASVTVIHKNWQVKIPQTGVYRIDSQPAQLRVYRGEAEVSTAGQTETVTVREGENLPFAEVLVPERAAIAAGGDSFKNWTMGRSQMISSDNATAAGIVDDPSLIDNPDAALAGLSYFPMTGIPSLGMTSPYGVSFWSPFQSRLSSMYYPSSLYGLLYPGWPIGARYVPFQPSRIVIPRHLAPPYGQIGTGGLRPGGIPPARSPYASPSLPRISPHIFGPRSGVHGGGHR